MGVERMWKPVKHYENYEVSETGQVRSVKSGRILSSYPDKDGYHLVRLSQDGISKTMRLAGMVARAFIPNPQNFPQVNHKDGKQKWNNAASNLEWNTCSQNMQHAVKCGLRVPSEKHHSAKLTWNTVDSIRKRYVKYNNCRGNGPELAAEFGVSLTAIHNVVKGKTWTHETLHSSTV
jgi:hypothetical protein